MWVPTYSGKHFNPFDPQQAEISLDDIAHSLSQTNRYNGHTVRPYSVAEHCVRVSSCVPHRVRQLAAVHDAAEAYLGDMVRPVKQRPEMKFFVELDADVSLAVYRKFDLTHLLHVPEMRELHRVDMLFVHVEMRLAGLYLYPDEKPPCEGDMIESDKDWEYCQWMFDTTNKADGDQWGWDPLTAKVRFMDRCRFLGIRPAT